MTKNALTQPWFVRPAVRRNARLVVVATALTLTAAACGGSSSSPAAGAGSPAPAASASSAAAFNATDAAFAAGMTPHHTGGIELGKLAADKGVDPAVKKLGRDIMAKQSQELTTLQGFLTAFGAQPDMSAPSDARDMRDMAKLKAAAGKAFDKLWLDVISGHHSAAIQMAKIEKAGGKNPAAVALADAIIVQQSAELTQFNAFDRQDAFLRERKSITFVQRMTDT